jgi:ABC-type multidrug transport system ATPase subunit
MTTDPEKVGPKAAEVDGRQMLQLLKNCSGAFEPGVLTALVGSSGAGKLPSEKCCSPLSLS